MSFYSLLKQHLVDTTALLVVSHPIYAAMETLVMNIPEDVSLRTRGIATVTSFAGLGWLYAKGRDASRGYFGIDQECSEMSQTVHDTGYAIGFAGAVSPVFYAAAGGCLEDTVYGTLGAMGLSIFSGPIMGYSLDAFRDLVGLQESHRLPSIVKNRSQRTKGVIAAGLLAASLALFGAVYVVQTDEGGLPERSSKSDK